MSPSTPGSQATEEGPTESVGRSAAPSPAPSSLSRHADFNRLWFGQTVSSFGSQISMMAIPLTAVLFLGANAVQVGLLSACERFAFIGPTLIFGVWVDRTARRPLMLATDLARAALLLAIPVLAWAHHLSMYFLYVAVLLVGCLSGLFGLAYRAYLPSVVSREQLEQGNRRLQSTDSLSQILGPTLGGFLVAALQAPFAVLIDAASFVVSAVSIAAVRTPEPRRAPTETRPGRAAMLREIGEGLRATVADPVLRALAGASAVFNFCTGVLLTLFVLYGIRDRGMSAAEIGLVNACFGAGGVLGATGLGWALRRFGYGKVLTCGYGLAAVSVMAIPLVSATGASATLLFGALYFVAGVTIISANIAEMTLRQLTVPANMLGRVTASFQFAIGALVPISALVAGYLGTAVGLRTTLSVVAAVIPFSLLWFVGSPVPRLRSVTPVEPVIPGTSQDEECPS